MNQVSLRHAMASRAYRQQPLQSREKTLQRSGTVHPQPPNCSRSARKVRKGSGLPHYSPCSGENAGAVTNPENCSAREMRKRGGDRSPPAIPPEIVSVIRVRTRKETQKPKPSHPQKEPFTIAALVEGAVHDCSLGRRCRSRLQPW